VRAEGHPVSRSPRCSVAPHEDDDARCSLRSLPWREIVASVLNLPLETTDVEEGAAYGAALLAGRRAETFAGPQGAVAREQAQTEPQREWAAEYADGHARFRRLYPALKAL
jgi:xylulokinase